MPTRYLKAGIRDSENIEKLSPMAECMFYRLLVTVDDFGRFDARPSMIRSACYPIRESMTAAKCEALLKELEQAGLIYIYTHDGKPYTQMRKWDNMPRAKESKFPPMCADATQLYADAIQEHTDAPLTVTVTKTETETKTKTKTETDCAGRNAAQIDVPGLDLQSWNYWQEYRSKIGKPIKTASLLAAKKAMAAFGSDQAAVVMQSVANGYQGLFQLKKGAMQAMHPPNKQQQLEDRADAVLAEFLAEKRGVIDV